jgi:cell wall-associated NlpC family hydrolase
MVKTRPVKCTLKRKANNNKFVGGAIHEEKCTYTTLEDIMKATNDIYNCISEALAEKKGTNPKNSVTHIEHPNYMSNNPWYGRSDDVPTEMTKNPMYRSSSTINSVGNDNNDNNNNMSNLSKSLEEVAVGGASNTTPPASNTPPPLPPKKNTETTNQEEGKKYVFSTPPPLSNSGNKTDNGEISSGYMKMTRGSSGYGEVSEDNHVNPNNGLAKTEKLYNTPRNAGTSLPPTPHKTPDSPVYYEKISINEGLKLSKMSKDKLTKMHKLFIELNEKLIKYQGKTMRKLSKVNKTKKKQSRRKTY